MKNEVHHDLHLWPLLIAFSLTSLQFHKFSKIFKDKDINFINKSELFAILKNANIQLDDSNINSTVNKIKFKDILQGIFTPNKARGYFLCGLVLIFSSIILPYHVYYVVVGSMLMLFSVICKILPFFEPSR